MMSVKKSATLLMGAMVLLSTTFNALAAGAKVERLNSAFPAEIMGEQDLMEAAPALEQNEEGEFFILKGEKLREAMLRWTKTAGYELVWQPKPEDGDIRFAANMTFRDTFEGASEQFFEVVRDQTKFDAQLHSNGVLRVFVANAKR